MVVQTVRYGGGVSVTEKSDCFLEANIDTLVGVSELAERFESRRNSQAVRWYVLTLPSCHRGPAVGLQRELDRRIRCGAGIRVLRSLVRRSEGRGGTFRPYPPSVALQLCFCPLVGKRDISDEAGTASIQLPAASAGRATRILSLPVRRGDAQPAMGGTLLLRRATCLYARNGEARQRRPHPYYRGEIQGC